MLFLRGVAQGDIVSQNHPGLLAVVALRRNACDLEKRITGNRNVAQ
jgi:hypothetical protein